MVIRLGRTRSLGQDREHALDGVGHACIRLEVAFLHGGIRWLFSTSNDVIGLHLKSALVDSTVFDDVLSLSFLEARLGERYANNNLQRRKTKSIDIRQH